MKVYADTSFLVSLYCLDANSSVAVREVRTHGPSLILTPLTHLELQNALQLRVFRGDASAAAIRTARSKFQQHIQDGYFATVAMPPTVYDLASRMAIKHTADAGNRTLDILHVASAMLLQAERFWTFDSRQAHLARTEGLKLR